MAFVHKPNKGTLFPNDRKERDEHPDHKGSANIDGKEYWLSAWEKDGRLNMSFTMKDARPDTRAAKPAPKPATRQPVKPVEEGDQDVPF